MIGYWLIVVFCLVGQGFFAMAELSIVSANPLRLEEAARAGSGAAERIQWFRANPERLFATTLLGTCACVVTGSTLASLVLTQMSPDHGELLTGAIMGPLVLIGAELVPKSIAHARGAELALTLARPLYFVQLLMYPGVWLVRNYARLLYKLLGVTERPAMSASREELQLLVEQTPPLSAEETPGAVEPGEREMITRILEFSHLTAVDSMLSLKEVCSISEDATVRDAAALISKEGYSRLPVFRGRPDDIVGILHHIDTLGAQDAALTVRALMKQPIFVPEGQEIDEILVILKRRAASAAIVVDEFGGAVGLLTLEDILEEIVGEIDDEFDVDARPWRQAPDGDGWLVAARTSIDLVAEALGLDLESTDDYDTLAGFVLEKLQHIPSVGEKVELPQDVEIVVTQATERAIDEVRIRGPLKPQGG